MSPSPSSRQVAALVPAWQSAGFIQATLDCLSAQTYGNLRVIVSVDLCDDDTHAICLAHASQDHRFQVIRQERRLGYVGNCNFLLGQSEADYVLFAFHDDILAPDYIASLAAVLDARPEAVMAFSDLQQTRVDGRQQHLVFKELEGVADRVQRAMIMLKGNNNWWVPNRGLFRLHEARRINGLKTHGADDFSADWPWLFHMSLLGEFARVPQTLCFKYLKAGSLSRTWAFSQRQYYEVRAACMRELWNSDLTTEEKLRITAPLANALIKNPPEAEPTP
jgi:glycosyltransferase involved in cell wall biosynthesis